jgi:2-iminobutanoate/2-iminopropanoate deaminase
VRTDGAPAPFQGAPYSQAIRSGGLVFVSGQVALEPREQRLVPGGVAEQTEQVFANLSAILQAAGSSLERVVKINVLLYDMLEFENMNAVYRQFFPKDPPARTTCGVQLSSGLKVEIECIALTD